MKQKSSEHLEQAIRYVGSFIFVFGIVFGILTCVVLNQPKMRKSKIRFYLLIQSINDIQVLGISLTDFLLRHAFRIDLHHLSPFLCKLSPFLERSLRQLASWIVVGTSLERLAGLLLPFFYFTSRHKHRPLSLVVAVVLLAGLNSPALYYNKLIDYKAEAEINSTGSGNLAENTVDNTSHLFPSFSTKVCATANQYYPASKIVFYLIYWLVPVIILIGTTAYFAKWLHNRQRWQRKSHDIHINVPNSGSGLKRHFRESLHSLFALNTFFVICFTPLTICELLQLTRSNFPITSGLTDSSSKVYLIAEARPTSCVAFQLFSYLFYATKFVLFMVFLTAFRKDFVNLLKKMSPFSLLKCIKIDMFQSGKRISVI